MTTEKDETLCATASTSIIIAAESREKKMDDLKESLEGEAASSAEESEEASENNEPATKILEPNSQPHPYGSGDPMDKSKREKGDILNEETTTKYLESTSIINTSISISTSTSSDPAVALAPTTIIETATANPKTAETETGTNHVPKTMAMQQSNPPILLRQQPSTAKTKVHLIAVGSARRSQ